MGFAKEAASMWLMFPAVDEGNETLEMQQLCMLALKSKPSVSKKATNIWLLSVEGKVTIGISYRNRQRWKRDAIQAALETSFQISRHLV